MRASRSQSGNPAHKPRALDGAGLRLDDALPRIVSAEPSDAKPLVAKPVVAKPLVAKPLAARPSCAEPTPGSTVGLPVRTPAGREWPLVAALAAGEARLGASALRQGPVVAGLYEFLRFGLKQGWACLFGGLLLGLILASRLWYPAGAVLERYDALVLAALAIQAGLLALRLETVQEARVILVFHLVGTLMELFKTQVGSWAYPEAGLLRVGHVPMFTGFLYAAVGSYLFRVWRLFDFRFDRHPRLLWLGLLSVAIYANFFADHWDVDLRWPLIGAAALLFGPATIRFKVWRVHRRMPLLLGLLLVALFIWLGENLGTAGHAWVYPAQARGWTMVPVAKLTSWFLLMLVSYTMVAASLLRRGPER